TASGRPANRRLSLFSLDGDCLAFILDRMQRENAMSELEDSRKSARHWKDVAVASWIVIAILSFILVTAIGGGAYLLLQTRARVMQERVLAEQARNAAEQQRIKAEEALKARN